MKKLEKEEKEYRVKGLTCPACAVQFEKEVKKISGVEKARVDYNRSTLNIIGESSQKELEKAGSFDNLQLSSSGEELKPSSLWANRAFIRTLISGILLLAGGFLQLFTPVQNLWPVALFVLSIILGGFHLFRQGLKNLIRLRFDMKTLMTVAILGAAIIGEWGEGALVVFLFAISQALETHSMERARSSIRSLMELKPVRATRLSNNREETVLAEELKKDDLVRVKPGEKIPIDGQIIRGSSGIDQSTITGESIPVSKNPGDEVFAGTINGEGLLDIRVTKEARDTTLARIIHLVERAQSEKAPSQAFVDRFARYYTPLVMGIALAIILIPPLLWGGIWSQWFYRGLALLVVACPCALVISTPVSIISAIGNAARNGVLIKGGIYLEETGRLETLAFDKTGTLTRGIPEVTDLINLNGEQENGSIPSWFRVAAAMEKQSSHPLARAILNRAEKEGLDMEKLQVQSLKAIPGKGLEAKFEDQFCYLGKPQMLREKLGEETNGELEHQVQILHSQGKTAMAIACDGKVKGVIGVRDQLRPSVREIMDALSLLGIKKTMMLTGDNQKTAEAMSTELGIENFSAELLPEDKLKTIRNLIESGEKIGMVGDGVNDSPTLARATVGIAMGGAGSDAALEAADIVLMADDLEKLPFLIWLSRKTLSIIRQNIALALLIKFLALALIVPGLLTLWMAVLADTGATLLVTLNGTRLGRVKAKNFFRKTLDKDSELK